MLVEAVVVTAAPALLMLPLLLLPAVVLSALVALVAPTTALTEGGGGGGGRPMFMKGPAQGNIWGGGTPAMGGCQGPPKLSATRPPGPCGGPAIHGGRPDGGGPIMGGGGGTPVKGGIPPWEGCHPMPVPPMEGGGPPIMEGGRAPPVDIIPLGPHCGGGRSMLNGALPPVSGGGAMMARTGP